MRLRLLLLAALPMLPSASRADDLGRLQGTWKAEAGPTGEVVVTLEVDGDRFEQTVETSPRSVFTFTGLLRLAGRGGWTGSRSSGPTGRRSRTPRRSSSWTATR